MVQGNEGTLVHVAAGLILDKGRVLITKRPKGTHLEGLWEFPGGKQEEGENLDACLEREIKEELGIRVKVQGFLLRVDHSYGLKMVALHIFECRILNGDPRGMEGQEIRWVYPPDLHSYHFPKPDFEALKLLSKSGLLRV